MGVQILPAASAVVNLDNVLDGKAERFSGHESYNKILGRVGYSTTTPGKKPQLSRDERKQARKEKKRKRRDKK